MLHKLSAGVIRRAGAAVAMTSVVAAASTMLAPAAHAGPISATTVGCSTTPSFDFTVPVSPPAGPPSLYETVGPDGTPFAGVAVLGGDRKAYGFFSQFFGDLPQATQMTCFDGGGIDQPAIIDNPQRTQIFITAPTHNIYFQDVNPDLTGNGWTKLANASSLTGVDAVATGDRTDIFYISNDANRSVMHMWQIGTQWSGPENLGGASIGDPPSVTRGADGKMHVWLTGTNGSVYFNSGDSNAWSGWTKVPSGTTLHGPAATVGYEPTLAREDVFVTGTNGDLYQATFTNLGGFKAWNKAIAGVGPDARLSAAAQGSGHMVVAMSSLDFVVETHFAAGGVWSDFFFPPYLCDVCLPGPSSATTNRTSTQSRPTAPSPQVRAR